MARYRRYRRTIIRAPRKKWASNIVPLEGNPQAEANGFFIFHEVMAENKTEFNAPTPVIIKTGNFKVQFDLTITVGASGAIDAKAFIIFLPQGVLPDSSMTSTNAYNTIRQHPEWIMAWRQLDFGNANAAGTYDTSVVKFSSRLKRNLNSGDRVMLLVIGSADFTGVTYKSQIAGMVQFWTCAN